tara:strand:+ start:622 stop:783 length:162 start_codon:yes stop_codon:yes gene_type:complete
MAKIKIITAKENDPIYQEGWRFSSLNYQYLKTRTVIEKTSSSSDKEKANEKKR